MSQTVDEFFQQYVQSTQSSDPKLISALYAETFMFAGPLGTQAVNRDAFAVALPKRQEYFKRMGLTRTTLESVEETSLDEFYTMVRAHWAMWFERDPQNPVQEPAAATYILHRQGGSLAIVLQLDHVDWTKHARELGLG